MLTRTQRLGIYGLAVLVAGMGIINVLSAWLVRTPRRMEILHSVLPLQVTHGTRLATVLAGAALIFLAWGLARRKQQAWRLTMLVLVGSLAFHLLKGLDYEEALGSLVVVLLFIILKPYFTAQSDRPSMQRGLVVFAAALLFGYLYGVCGFYLLDHHFGAQFNLAQSSTMTLMLFFEPGYAPLTPITHRGQWFLDSVYVVGACSLGFALLMLLRPVVHRRTVEAHEREAARAIVQQHGRSSLAWFTLLKDKTYFFNASGSTFIAYRLTSNVALALGDPIGPDEDIADTIAAFQKLCEDNDWYPAFYQTLPDYLPLYEAQGFRALKIGEEAIVELADFNLAGGKWKSVRQAVNKLMREGYKTVLHAPPVSDDVLRELKSVSDEWLASMHGSEKTFSLGMFDFDYLRECPILVVNDADGKAVAFANIVSEYHKSDGTIDLMRRRTDAPNGIMDFLFVQLAEHFKAQGYTGFNLGLSPLAGVGEEADADLPERAVKFLYEHFNRFYSFKGLHYFKSKFNPRWEPRYLIYPTVGVLPKVALAIVRADSSEGLLSYLKRRGG